jgi:uncharacterized protein YfiM (DUF2279 family)
MKLKLKMEMGMEAGVLQNKQRARSWERPQLFFDRTATRYDVNIYEGHLMSS